MKNKWFAILLCFFLGWLGLHHFYLNNKGRGMFYLVFCWTGLPLVFSLFDFLGLLFTGDNAFNIKYNHMEAIRS
jgi:TM2 domain-containing membrane protein YozV